jgi:hypothetical protein
MSYLSYSRRVSKYQPMSEPWPSASRRLLIKEFAQRMFAPTNLWTHTILIEQVFNPNENLFARGQRSQHKGTQNARLGNWPSCFEFHVCTRQISQPWSHWGNFGIPGEVPKWPDLPATEQASLQNGVFNIFLLVWLSPALDFQLSQDVMTATNKELKIRSDIPSECLSTFLNKYSSDLTNQHYITVLHELYIALHTSIILW